MGHNIGDHACQCKNFVRVLSQGVTQEKSSLYGLCLLLCMMTRLRVPKPDADSWKTVEIIWEGADSDFQHGWVSAWTPHSLCVHRTFELVLHVHMDFLSPLPHWYDTTSSCSAGLPIPVRLGSSVACLPWPVFPLLWNKRPELQIDETGNRAANFYTHP